jgi:hypothetical protein
MKEGGPHFDGEQATEPFLAGETLKEGEFSIRELKDNPDKIVRTESMVGSVEETIAHYKNIKTLFELMKSNYGVNVPDMDVIIGESEPGKQSVFMIVDKIEGKDLGEVKVLPEDVKDKFENFYTNFLQSIFDEYKKEKPFFRDIKVENIMYGHKSKEKDAQDDFFLTDVGGGFQEGNFIEFHGQLIETDYNEAFFRSMINAKSDLQKYEKMFGENAELEAIKGKMEEIYEYCRTKKQQELKTFFAKDPTTQEFFESPESNVKTGKKPETKLTPNEIKIEWQKILSKLPGQLQQELLIERPDPIQEDVEYFESLNLANPKPMSISIEELLKNNEDCVLRCPPDVIEEINKKWGTKFDAGLSNVYDQNPGRFRQYSQMPPETAQPSVLINGEIIFGSGRFIAALLRKDSDLRVWDLRRDSSKK